MTAVALQEVRATAKVAAGFVATRLADKSIGIAPCYQSLLALGFGDVVAQEFKQAVARLELDSVLYHETASSVLPV